MTDSDLRDARKEVDKRIEWRQQRGRRLGVVVAAAAATVVVVGVAAWQGLRGDDANPNPAGPGPSPAPSELSEADELFLIGPAPTRELLEGVWRLDDPTTSRMLVSFTADGGIRWDDTGRLSEDPLVSGTYHLDGERLTVEVHGGPAGCAGHTLAFRAAVNERRGLNVVPVDAEVFSCGRPLRQRWVLEQVLPVPEGGDVLKAPPGASWNPPAGHDAVGGTWSDPSGAYVVELRMDGSYTTLTGRGEVADRGTWAADGSSTLLTMVSSADSPTCQEGDRFVLGSLRQRNLGTLVLQADLERNDCAVPWSGNGWFRLAP